MLVRKQYEFAMNDPDIMAQFVKYGLRPIKSIDMPITATPGHVKFSMNVVYDDAWVMNSTNAPRRDVVVFLNGDSSGKIGLTHDIVQGITSKGQLYVEIFEANDSTVNWSDADPTKILGSHHSYTKVWMSASDPDMEAMYSRRALELAQLLEILTLMQAKFNAGLVNEGYPMTDNWLLIGQSAGAGKSIWLHHLLQRAPEKFNWASKFKGVILSSLVITPVRYTSGGTSWAEFLRYDRFMPSFQRAFAMNKDTLPIFILQNAGDDAANQYMREIMQVTIPSKYRDKIFWYSDASRGHGGDWKYITGQAYRMLKGLPLQYVDISTYEVKPMLNLTQLIKRGITKID